MTNQSRPLTLWLLALCLLFLAGGGLYGGIAFLSDSSGASIGMSAVYLAKLPVSDFRLPGLFLITIFGALPLYLLYALLVRPQSPALTPITRLFHEHWSWGITLLLGIVVLGWMFVQVIYGGIEAPVQFVILALGALIVVLELLPSIRHYFEELSS